jgi:hypothetical protein
MCTDPTARPATFRIVPGAVVSTVAAVALAVGTWFLPHAGPTTYDGPTRVVTVEDGTTTVLP